MKYCAEVKFPRTNFPKTFELGCWTSFGTAGHSPGSSGKKDPGFQPHWGSSDPGCFEELVGSGAAVAAADADGAAGADPSCSSASTGQLSSCWDSWRESWTRSFLRRCIRSSASSADGRRRTRRKVLDGS